MEKHPIDILIERKINLVKEIEDYLDKLVLGKYERFEMEKWRDGTYWLSMDFEVDLHDIRVSSMGFYITTAEIYQRALLMHSTQVSEVIENYISERLSEVIEFMLSNTEDDEIEETTE